MNVFQFYALVLLASGCVASQAGPNATTSAPSGERATRRVVLASEVQWQDLNPARGDKSPKAATLWGDRNGTGPTGFLLRPVDGFRSPPHIHNVSYRGVVIRGLIHNAHPDAEEVWMPAGSFWTQPEGGVHITAARGTDTLAYIEIDEGPYLVRSASEAIDDVEDPINQDASKIEWTQITGATGGAMLALLWGKPEDEKASGSFVKLPAGFAGVVHSHGPSFRAVAIQGRPEHREPGAQSTKSLAVGSFFSSKGEATWQLSCEGAQHCILYVRTDGSFEVREADPEQ